MLSTVTSILIHFLQKKVNPSLRSKLMATVSQPLCIVPAKNQDGWHAFLHWSNAFDSKDAVSLHRASGPPRVIFDQINGTEPVFPESITNLCTRFQRKVISLLKSFTASCFYSQCSFVLLFQRILWENQISHGSNDHNTRPETSEQC